MQVFDFDNTIYDGECCLDFFVFCVKKKKSLVIHLPKIFLKALKYKLMKIPISEVSEFVDYALAIFFGNCKDLDALLTEFWQMNSRKLRPHMLKKIQPGDVIVSASPDFLLRKIKTRLSPAEVLCTQVDMRNKKITFLCYGENKVHAFTERFPDTIPEIFYTDNKNDKPMMNFSKKSVLVRSKKRIFV